MTSGPCLRSSKSVSLVELRRPFTSERLEQVEKLLTNSEEAKKSNDWDWFGLENSRSFVEVQKQVFKAFAEIEQLLKQDVDLRNQTY